MSAELIARARDAGERADNAVRARLVRCCLNWFVMCIRKEREGICNFWYITGGLIFIVISWVDKEFLYVWVVVYGGI